MTIFFAADHHLQHNNILKFRDKDNGKFLRTFSTVEDMNEHIIGRHNAVVGRNDTVYMMGDIAWKTNRQTRDYLSRLNGKLVLIPGNHDHLKWLWETGAFTDMHMWKYMPEHSLIVSHIPLSNEDVARAGFNIHGHIHQNAKAITYNGQQVLDPRYFCASMERIEYTPIPLELVLQYRKAMQDNVRRIVESAKPPTE